MIAQNQTKLLPLSATKKTTASAAKVETKVETIKEEPPFMKVKEETKTETIVETKIEPTIETKVEPVKEGFISSDVEVISFEAVR